MKLCKSQNIKKYSTNHLLVHMNLQTFEPKAITPNAGVNTLKN